LFHCLVFVVHCVSVLVIVLFSMLYIHTLPISSLFSLISLFRQTSLTNPTSQYVRLCPHCSIVLYLASLFSPTLLCLFPHCFLCRHFCLSLFSMLSLSSLDNLSSLFFCPRLLSSILSVSLLCLCPHCCLCPQYWLFLHCCLNPTFSLSSVLSLSSLLAYPHFCLDPHFLLFCLCSNFVSDLIGSFPHCFLCHCCLSLFSM
jgi:hypothetical protein